MSELSLYHTGFDIIESPDISVGRANADFGRGFYLSDDREFSVRWARVRREKNTYINKYLLDLSGLKTKTLVRSSDWFEYIFDNRRHRSDRYAGYDVITGPIANDTIFDTLGITTSGVLSDDQALRLLLIGPEYKQIVLKTERAALALRFEGYETVLSEEINGYREKVKNEENEYLEKFSTLLETFDAE